jgi:hypothetical protein
MAETIESECPSCQTKVRVEPMEAGDCPKCDRTFWWKEYWDDDGNNWFELEWED